MSMPLTAWTSCNYLGMPWSNTEKKKTNPRMYFNSKLHNNVLLIDAHHDIVNFDFTAVLIPMAVNQWVIITPKSRPHRGYQSNRNKAMWRTSWRKARGVVQCNFQSSLVKMIRSIRNTSEVVQLHLLTWTSSSSDGMFWKQWQCFSFTVAMLEKQHGSGVYR